MNLYLFKWMTVNVRGIESHVFIFMPRDKKVSAAAEIAEQMTLRKIYGHLQIKLLKDEIPQYSACKFGSIQFCNSMCPFILQIWLYLVKNFSYLNFILENAMRASLSMDPTICAPENS